MDTLDWNQLSGTVNKDTNKIEYGPNKHLFRKIAFDVFQLNSSPVESLWTLEDDAVDGKQYLVATYTDEKEEQLEAKGSWNTAADRDHKNITLFYKDTPIQRFASEEYGFKSDDSHLFEHSLTEKLHSDSAFVTAFLHTQDSKKLAEITSKFPELKSFV